MQDFVLVKMVLGGFVNTTHTICVPHSRPLISHSPLHLLCLHLLLLNFSTHYAE